MPAPIIAGTDLDKTDKGHYSGENGAPDPTGGSLGEIGQYIYDPDCRYSTTDHKNDCKDIFGPEWGYGGSGHHFDPYGHKDRVGAHYHCPAGGFYHKCERKEHTGNKYDCCIKNIHETNKTKTGPSTCKVEWRGHAAEGCYSTVRSYCAPQGTMEKTKERANEQICKDFCSDKGDKCHQMWKKICHTKNANDLKQRLKDPDCFKYFWQYSSPKPGTDSADFYNRWENVASTVDVSVKDIFDSEQEEYCFKTVNGKYVNIDKNFDDIDDANSNLGQLGNILDCRDLCAKSKELRVVNKGKDFKFKCERGWRNKCKELGFDKFGSSNIVTLQQPSRNKDSKIDYTKLCPLFWDKEKVKLTKVGELTDQAKRQKPDKCSFAALTQLDWKESGVREPICWYPELSPANNTLTSLILPSGEESELDKIKAICPTHNTNVCCQMIKLGDNVSAKNINIKQNCSLPELQDPNTITTFEGYALRVPWLAPPFEPDPKCEETPVPTGVVCTEPKPYQDFGNWLEDQITYDPDEVVSILQENWDRKEAAEKALLDKIAADIVAKTTAAKAREPTSPPKEKTWWERIIEWFRKIFGLKKKKTLKELQEEADKKLEEETEETEEETKETEETEENVLEIEAFTDISKKNSIFFIILFVFLIIIFKIQK